MQEHKRARIAWVLYDFANSAYALVIAGVVYQLYFKKVAFDGAASDADLYWGVTVSLSILLSAVVSPLIGAMMDSGPRARAFLTGFTLTAITATALLWTIGPGDRLAAIAIFIVANATYNIGLFIYDSFLPRLEEREVGRFSGLAWGVGYLGGITCLALAFPLLRANITPTETGGARAAFLLVATFFLFFSVPAFLWLPKGTQRDSPATDARRSPMASLRTTFRNWRSNTHVFRFILAYFLISEAITTAIYFTANFLSTTLKLPTMQILAFTVLVQLVGFPTTWFSGSIADRVGLRRMLLLSASGWCVLVVLLGSSTSGGKGLLIATFTLMGLLIGSSQAVGRAMLATLAPPEQSGTFFGLNSLSTRAAATIGPLLFGAVSHLSGSQRVAWYSLVPFLIAGMLLVPRQSNADGDMKQSAPAAL